jgi:D-alanyl-D-alanine carboxypeptidase
LVNTLVNHRTVQEKLNKPDILATLQSTLQEGIEVGVPGLSAGICSSQGILWQSSAGLIDVEAQKPVNKTHLFGIGSITKVFVSVVILQLVDEKKLRLSVTLGDILDREVFRGIENAPEATVAGLLSHTAGVDSWEEDPVWIINGRGKVLDLGKIWGKAETLDYVRRPNPSGPKPGEWSYSNTNFTLLGLIIEKITQHTADGEIRRRILEPLSMNHTYLEGFEEPRPETSSRRYHWATDTFRKTAGICPSFSQPRDNLIDATGSNLSVEWTAGGMVSSPSDLLIFAIALRDGKLLSSSSLEVMKDWRPASGTAEMGHGLFRFQSPMGAGKWLGHFGSVLGFTGALWWKEEGDCAVCVLANIGTVHAGDVPSSACDVVAKKRFLRLASELAACE